MASKKKRNRPQAPGGSRPAGAKAPAGSATRPRAAAKPGADGAAKPGADGAAKPAAGGAAKPGPKPAGKPKTTAKPATKTTAKPGGDRGPTRAERLAAAETARRRRASRNRAVVIGAVAALLALITVTVVNSRRSGDRVVNALEAGGACNYDTRADSDGGQGRNHVNGDVRYDVDPPAGGNHAPAAAPPGEFTTASRPSDAQIVHSLEHGYVAIWHRPDLDPAALEDLRGLAGRYDRDVLLVPRESLEQPVAATAWHRRLLCSRPDVAALERFVTEFRNKGPEKVPH